jgi:hypothetical protein
MLNGLIDGPSATSLSKYRKTAMSSPHIPNLSSQSLSLSLFSPSSSTLSALSYPSLYGALAAAVDEQRAVGGGAFSLSRVCRSVDPPSSSSRVDESSSSLLCPSFSALMSCARPPKLLSVSPSLIPTVPHPPCHRQPCLLHSRASTQRTMKYACPPPA